MFFCPAGDLPVLVIVVQNLTGVFCPADLPVFVTVFQYLTGVFCPADLPVLVTVFQYLTGVFCPAGDLTAAPDGADGESGGATAPP